VDIARSREQFLALFPDAHGDLFIARAPGRVNLIGEHTDYNDGYVCPMAIDRQTSFVFAPRADARVRIHAAAIGQTDEFSIEREVPREGPRWALYPRGAVEAMRRQAGITRGFDAYVDTSIPLGGGLSSSAAFEVAAALAALSANARTMDPVQLALACQWAEHTYPGVPCGIMDQFISVMGRKGHAMLLDCRDRAVRHVPLADPEICVIVCDSQVKHALVTGEYRRRRTHCEMAAAHFKLRHGHVQSLRDVTPALLDDDPPADPVTLRRARHVVTEIVRTARFADALQHRDYAVCGRLMYESHASLRDDYEVSSPELDALVEISRGVEGVFGARMTGGGFGGCTVSLCLPDAAAPLAAAIAQRYPLRSGGKQAAVFATAASAGASVAPLA
jgi:galactokinase